MEVSIHYTEINRRRFYGYSSNYSADYIYTVVWIFIFRNDFSREVLTMNLNDVMQIVLFTVVFSLSAYFIGNYMANVFSGRKHLLSFLNPLERLTYRMLKIKQEEQMGWKEYAISIGYFSVFSIILLGSILMTQKWLPLNPQKLQNLPWDLALNTAVSFVTNTNWQAYSGEISLSYFSQMLGLDRKSVV